MRADRRRLHDELWIKKSSANTKNHDTSHTGAVLGVLKATLRLCPGLSELCLCPASLLFIGLERILYSNPPEIAVDKENRGSRNVNTFTYVIEK